MLKTHKKSATRIKEGALKYSEYQQCSFVNDQIDPKQNSAAIVADYWYKPLFYTESPEAVSAANRR